MLQLGVSASAAASTVHAAAGLSSVPAQLVALLGCLIEHRPGLLLPDCASVIVALLRASIHSLSGPLPSAASRTTALAIARLLTRLPAAVRPAASSSSSSSEPLSAALPVLLHDYLFACRQCAAADGGLVWQSVLQPAVAALLRAMSEHDISATHLVLPSAERELFKPVIAQYKRELRYRGQ